MNLANELRIMDKGKDLCVKFELDKVKVANEIESENKEIRAYSVQVQMKAPSNALFMVSLS